MHKTAFIFINGIFTHPRRKDAWNDRAVEYVKRFHPDCHAVSYEYLSGAIMRHGWIPFRDAQLERANAVVKKVNQLKHQGYRVVMVGHSNGCQLISYLIAQMGERVANVHFFAPASFAVDIATALDEQTVEGVFIYGSTRDIPLRFFAPISRILTLGLSGYGSLGTKGLEMEEKYPGQVFDFSNNKFGHSDWFTKENFDNTMALIMVNEGFIRVGNQTQEDKS